MPVKIPKVNTMRKSKGYIKFTTPALFLLFFILLFPACQKISGNAPTIEFKTDKEYTYSDVTVAPDSYLSVGITAQKGEANLATFDVTVRYNGNNALLKLQEYQLVSFQQYNYDKDISLKVRSITGTEKYFFTITDTAGNRSQVSFTATVK